MSNMNLPDEDDNLSTKKASDKNISDIETSDKNISDIETSDKNISDIEASDKKCVLKANLLSGFVGAAIMMVIIVVVYIVVFKPYILSHLSSDGDVLLDSKTVNKLNEVEAYIDRYYYGDYDESDLQNGVIGGLVSGLDDKYSVYYTAEEFSEQKISTSGTYYGIGAGLSQDKKTKQVTITKVYNGTPSEEAGLKKDDKLISVDNIDATSMDLTKLVEKIRGNEGTTVHLKIYRESTDETFEVDVERKNVELASVDGKMLNNGIGYIQISEFQSKTAEQFDDALSKLESSEMKGLIIDLRGNPGGMLPAVTKIAERILPTEKVKDLPKGTVVYTKDKNGTVETYGSDDGKQVDCPIVVLIDQNSASASEILAGALKDYNSDGYIDAVLVGKTSFGKGIVQTVFDLKDGDAVKLTTSKYYTPNGYNIHGIGIDPDIDIDYEYTGNPDSEYDMNYDNQLQKAIEVINEKI